MRLINIYTLEVRTFIGKEIPEYAILSHRWYNSDNEVCFASFSSGCDTTSAGYQKVLDFCTFVKENKDRFWPARTTKQYSEKFCPGIGRPQHNSTFLSKVDWIWIDTCCIDKSSSAELSESINSMYQYYAQARACIVYLHDVTAISRDQDLCATGCEQCEDLKHQIKRSEWFKRGWTLQELVAPHTRVFVSSDWGIIGGIFDLMKWTNAPDDVLLGCVAEASNIPPVVLTDGRQIRAASIAQRLSWAANRVTTRPEDRAYSLFGLLQVNLPLLYGEGTHAWLRLQQEVIRSSGDESIFAWENEHAIARGCSLFPQPVLAGHLEWFADCSAVRNTPRFERIPYSITNQGLELRLRSSTAFLTFPPHGRVVAIPLNCGMTTKDLTCDAEARVLVLQRRAVCGHYERLGCPEAKAVPDLFRRVDHQPDWIECDDETIYVHTSPNDCQSGLESGESVTTIRATPHMSSVLRFMDGSRERYGGDNTQAMGELYRPKID